MFVKSFHRTIKNEKENFKFVCQNKIQNSKFRETNRDNSIIDITFCYWEGFFQHSTIWSS